MSTPAPAETPTVTPEPASFDLAAFRKGEITADGKSTTPAAAKAAETPAVAVEELPDPEVEADPDLKAAIDALEAPKDNETPAEKAARTKRHKESARKGYATRQKNRADRAEAQARELQQQLEDVRRRPAPSGTGDDRRAVADRPAHVAETDPTDPEPTLESVTAKYPNDPDPYERKQRELAAWDRRQERRQEQLTHQREQDDRRDKAIAAHIRKHEVYGESVHADFVAVVTPFAEALRKHPDVERVVFNALGEIADDKVGAELQYRLAKHANETIAAIQGGEYSLLRYLGRLERDITAAAAPPKKEEPAAPIVSIAPAPHTPVAGAAAAAPQNPALKSGTDLSLRELRAWDAKHGRRSA